MSKKASLPSLHQNPLALTSKRAASSVFAAVFSCSPVSGCSGGSVDTFGHTSVKKDATRSLTSLWRSVGYPPRRQISLWSAENASPHTHFGGVWGSGHPYLSARASRNAPLWRAKPWHDSGRAVSHSDAPFSCATRTDRRRPGCRLAVSRVASAWLSRRFSLITDDFTVRCKSLAFSASPPCVTMLFTNGADILLDALNCFAGSVVGSIRPSPPCLAGKANSRRVVSFGGGWPVNAGIRRWRIAHSKGCSTSAVMPEIRVRNTHRPTRPWVKAVKAACGCCTANSASLSTSLTHEETFDLKKKTAKSSVPSGPPR